jgi:hypothetical protein
MALFVAQVRRRDPAADPLMIEAGLGFARKAAFARPMLRRQAIEIPHIQCNIMES